ncbi:MAG: hypothetical protein IT159_00075 [Bryobacterales bacterium]|nr:hypothetical protein [Bryobacterales bacterium]
MLRIAVVFLTVALSVASAKSYTVNLFQPAVLAGTELQAGQYKLEVDGSKIRLKNGPAAVEADVQVENTPQRHRSTSLRLERKDSRMHIKEIRLGGTNVQLVVN